MDPGTIAYATVFEVARTVVAVVLSGVSIFLDDAPAVAVAVQIAGLAALQYLARSKSFLRDGPFATVRVWGEKPRHGSLSPSPPPQVPWAAALRRALLAGALGAAAACAIVLAAPRRAASIWAVFAGTVLAMAASLALDWSPRRAVECLNRGAANKGAPPLDDESGGVEEVVVQV